MTGQPADAPGGSRSQNASNIGGNADASGGVPTEPTDTSSTGADVSVSGADTSPPPAGSTGQSQKQSQNNDGTVVLDPNTGQPVEQNDQSTTGQTQDTTGQTVSDAQGGGEQS